MEKNFHCAPWCMPINRSSRGPDDRPGAAGALHRSWASWQSASSMRASAPPELTNSLHGKFCSCLLRPFLIDASFPQSAWAIAIFSLSPPAGDAPFPQNS